MTENGSRVAFVVVNWNTWQYLTSCLDAIMRQTVPPGRILVVDNASTDGSVQQMRQQYPQVELIALQRNTGFAAGNNVALSRVVQEDWLALVNPDAYLAENWLEEMLNAVDSYPNVACFGSRLLQAHELSTLDGVGDVYHVSGLAWRGLHGLPSDRAPDRDVEIFSPCAAAALYRTEAVRRIGGFDERYFCYFEDTDLGFRMRLAGFRAMYVAGAVVRHVGSAATTRQSDFALYHGHRNLVWTFIKNMPAGMLWRYLPQHVLLNIVSLFVFSVRGRGIIWKSKLDALKGLPQTLRDRKKAQALRNVSNRDLMAVMARGFCVPYRNRREHGPFA